MTLAVEQPRNVDVPPPILMKRWTVQEYHKLIELGIFAHDERFELLEGWIVAKVSKNPPHESSVHLTNRACQRRLPSEWDTRIQAPITLEDSEPEPDVAIVRGDARTYACRHPSPSDIAIVIEVADSSLLDDRRRKMRLYALAGIAEFWIINISASQIEVHSDPTGPSGAPAYRKQVVWKIDQSVPLVVDGQQLSPIPVKDLLP